MLLQAKTYISCTCVAKRVATTTATKHVFDSMHMEIN